MTPEKIQGLARQAGIPKWIGHNGSYTDVSSYLVKFATLVAQHTREECAKVCDAREITAPDGSDEQCEAADCAAAIRKLNKDAK